MQAAINKLQQDLAYIKAMSQEVVNYMYSNVVYWPSLNADIPDLTLGGYVMRQRRLQILAYLLTNSEQDELKKVIAQFKDLTFDRVAIMEKKATQELKIRINQWEQHLQEYWDVKVIEQEYYKTDVQVRTIITDMIVRLGTDPYHLDHNLVNRIHALDVDLRNNWKVGEFIWPEEWIPAYGLGDYWYLYGLPTVSKENE